jgi:hypothetical protein
MCEVIIGYLAAVDPRPLTGVSLRRPIGTFCEDMSCAKDSELERRDLSQLEVLAVVVDANQVVLVTSAYVA